MSRQLWIPLLLLVGLLSVLFFSSSQPYHEQDMRGSIKRYVNEQAIRDRFGDVSFHYGSVEVNIERQGVAGFVEFFIRKGVHLVTFMALAYILYRVFIVFLSFSASVGWSGYTATAIAVLDEWHQSFTPDRTAMVTDVLLDSTGVLVTILLLLAFRRKGSRSSTRKGRAFLR